MSDFYLVGGPYVEEYLRDNHTEVTALVAQTYIHHHNRNTENPDSYFLRFSHNPANRIIALPAALYPEDTAGIKWIASFPQNIENNLQRASAVLILNSLVTGYPYACIESSLISAYRTAASAVLGAWWLNGKSRKTASVGFVGAGVIARTISDFFIRQEWQFDDVSIYDLHLPSAGHFVDYLHTEHRQNARHVSLDNVLECDIVVFATTASKPYTEKKFQPHQIILNISLRDIAPESILVSQNIVDDIEHCLKAETSPHLAEQLVSNREFISGTLAGLMTGEFDLRQDKPKIFSPFGLGVLDLALGKHLCDKAIATGKASKVNDFFPNTVRWTA